MPIIGAGQYPNNLECEYYLHSPSGSPVSLQFTNFAIDETDSVQLFNTNTNGVKLHSADGLTGKTVPFATYSATSGTLLLRFKSDPLRTERGWRAIFSADCPPLKVKIRISHAVCLSAARWRCLPRSLTFSR